MKGKRSGKGIAKAEKVAIMGIDVTSHVVPPADPSSDSKKNFRSRAHKRGDALVKSHGLKGEKAKDFPCLVAQAAAKRWTELHG